MDKMGFSKLYWRIWLAIVLAVAVLCLSVLGIWQLTKDEERMRLMPPREFVLRNAQGEQIAVLQADITHTPGQLPHMQLRLPNGDELSMQRPWRVPQKEVREPQDHAPRMGRERGVEMPRRTPASFGFWAGIGSFWGFSALLLGVAVAVAIGAYPIVRRLTQRLEALHAGVQRLEAGDFQVRLDVQGNDEIADLAQQFNAAVARIDALMQSKKNLLANASHELRSPLARMRMSVELLSSATDTGLQNAPQLQAEMRRCITELDDLVGEILLASRLDAAAPSTPVLQREWVDVTGLAAEECARVNAQLHVPSGASMELHADAKLLRRLLRNLLENAKRHASQVVGLATVPHDGIHCLLFRSAQALVVYVADNGPGVSAQERARVFEPFYRVQGFSEQNGGTGLGLALVRSIALQHGGQVRCMDALDLPPDPALNPIRACTGAVFEIKLDAKGA